VSPAKKSKARRLDGKQKLLCLTAQMTRDLHSYRVDNKIESESELIRQAIAAYIYRDYDDGTLKLSGLKDIRESVSHLRDMVSVLFSYLHEMHKNLLTYHAEILTDDLKKAAFASAESRTEKFFSYFQGRLKSEPRFFERLLHQYFTGALDE